MVFAILSRRSVSAVSVGVSAKRQNANGPMNRAGGMLGAMTAAMVGMKNAAGTSLLKKGIVGVALRFGAFAAATDGRLALACKPDGWLYARALHIPHLIVKVNIRLAFRVLRFG